MDIILIPGFWLGASSWSEVAPALEQAGHRVRALTLPGLESADADRSDIGLRDQVDAVIAAVDQRNGGLYTGAFILCATDAYGQSSTYGRDESMPCFASTSVPGSGAYSAAARQVGQPGEQRRLVTVHARRLIE